MGSSKEIKTGQILRAKLRLGVNQLSNVVKSTLGPSGSTVIIPDVYGEPYITKDGVSVAERVQLEDPIENIAATILKQVSKNTVEQAGDGTTTSIVLAQALINTGYDLLNAGISYNEIKEHLDNFEFLSVGDLTRTATPLTTDNLIHVATISANNDEGMGALIKDAYDHSTIVKVEEGSDLQDKLTTVNGMELPTGLFENAFINVSNKQAVVYEDPLVILIEGKLDKLDDISGLLNDVGERPVIIIADHFSGPVVSILKDNYNRGALNIALVKSPGFASHRVNLMEDIAVYTGATLLQQGKKYKGAEYYGTLSSVFITKDSCILTNSKNTVAAEERLKDLKAVRESTKEPNAKVLLDKRIEYLTGSVSIIRVGGKSELEMRERKDRIDDAVLAVKCALEEGVVSGGGIALLSIYLDGILKPNHFNHVLETPHDTILRNGTNVPVATKEEMLELGIIDPLKVTRIAIQNAVSVAKTILSTNAVVLNEALWT